ncbi:MULTISPECIES: DUF2971 domain-containing protein [Serratia]|nr:DUF2971 domain-containing protein [Serratia marcescens]OYO93985.1 hypothetical protein CHR63_21635 [Serratia marcescens]
MYIYKYRKFDDNNINALRDNKIWFSRGVNFNDPFDCSLNVPLTLMSDSSIKEFIIRNTTNSSLFDFAKNNEDMLNSVIFQQIERSRELLSETGIKNHELFPVYNIVAASLLRSFICCFSTESTNPLLWSHYADRHSGFCIRFKKNVLLDDLSPFEYDEVKYSDDPINLLEGIYDGSNPAKKIIFSKSQAWSYEKEYRLIHRDISRSEDDNHRVCQYSDEAIDCIILGYNSSLENLNDLKMIFHDRDVIFKRIVRSQHGYKLYVGSERL